MTFNSIPLAELNAFDIESLCSESVPEGEALEFKENLSVKGVDKWSTQSALKIHTEAGWSSVLRKPKIGRIAPPT
jgi:hypothetical protein